MIIGVLKFTLHTPEARSLKDRRQATKGLLKQLARSFPAAVAEVEPSDLWQLTRVAAAVIGPDGRQADAIMQKMITFVEDHSTEVVMSDVSTQLVSV